MKTRCERSEDGQTEIGIIEHNGREFAAMGSAVQGTHVAGYLGKGDTLKTWCGKTMLDVRSERCGNYRDVHGDKTFGVIFWLPRGRAIVGYAMGEGMLFRGELIDVKLPKRNRHGVDWQEARHQCRRECEYWLERDAEDDAVFQEQCRIEDEQERHEDMLADLT